MGILDLAGLNEDGVGYHSFRHTYARIFIESGGRFEELQKSLRHSSIVTTETLYGHFHEDVAAKLAGDRIYAMRA
jgi:integrase